MVVKCAFCVLVALAISGCASEITVPVTGQMSNGLAMAGQSTARMSAPGDFWVQAPGGLRCSGQYDASIMEPTIVIPVQCSDGAAGEVVATRRVGTGGGVAIAKLKDGRTGQFVFGNLTFEQAYGAGGKATLR